jgi:hypothetical protein
MGGDNGAIFGIVPKLTLQQTQDFGGEFQAKSNDILMYGSRNERGTKSQHNGRL